MAEERKWPSGQPITVRVSIRTLTPEFEAEFGPIVDGFWQTLGSRPAVLKDAAEVLGLVERHGRFDLVELITSPGYQQTGEIVIEFENGYD